MNVAFRDVVNKLPGDGILRREADDAVLTPEGWMIGGVRLGVAGVLGFSGNRVVTAVWGVVTVRVDGDIVLLVEVFATSAFTFWIVGVASADTLNGGKFEGSNDWWGIMAVREVSRGVWAVLVLLYEGIEVLIVSPWSRLLTLEKGGVLGILWDGSGGGGDLYRVFGFGLPRGLLVFFGDVFTDTNFDAIFFSLISFGIGGTGGTPFCPATTMRDFRLDAFVASRKIVFGEGWPDDIVPDADDPIPESRNESRFEGGDGDGVLEGVVCVFNVGSRVAFNGAANFFSNVDEVSVGRGSSSLVMIVWDADCGGWLSRLASLLASVGLIVLAPRPLAPGMKLVRRAWEPSFGATESLVRALDGDIGSFSMLAFLRLGVETTTFPVLSVVGGPMEDIVAEVLGPMRFCGEDRFTGDRKEVDIDSLCPNSRSEGIGDEEGKGMLLRSRDFVDDDIVSVFPKGILYDPERDSFGGDEREVTLRGRSVESLPPKA
jgi:hypothetical protein